MSPKSHNGTTSAASALATSVAPKGTISKLSLKKPTWIITVLSNVRGMIMSGGMSPTSSYEVPGSTPSTTVTPPKATNPLTDYITLFPVGTGSGAQAIMDLNNITKAAEEDKGLIEESSGTEGLWYGCLRRIG